MKCPAFNIELYYPCLLKIKRNRLPYVCFLPITKDANLEYRKTIQYNVFGDVKDNGVVVSPGGNID